jgi:hypothetical protein
MVDQRRQTWRGALGDILRILTILSPLMLGAFAWARSTETKVTILKERQDMVIAKWEEQSLLNAELVHTLQDVQLKLAALTGKP